MSQVLKGLYKIVWIIFGTCVQKLGNGLGVVFLLGFTFKADDFLV